MPRDIGWRLVSPSRVQLEMARPTYGVVLISPRGVLTGGAGAPCAAGTHSQPYTSRCAARLVGLAPAGRLADNRLPLKVLAVSR